MHNIQYVKRKSLKCVNCHKGEHRFSETGYSELFGKRGSFKEYAQAAESAAYGLSAEPVADVLERDIRTVETWLKAIGKKGRQFHLSTYAKILVYFYKMKISLIVLFMLS